MIENSLYIALAVYSIGMLLGLALIFSLPSSTENEDDEGQFMDYHQYGDSIQDEDNS